MKKICFIVQRYHPEIGGTEFLAKNILESIAEKSNEIDISIITQPCADRKDYIFPINEISFREKDKFNSFIKVSNFDLCIFLCDLHAPYLGYYEFGCRKNICILNLDETTYHNIDNWNLESAINVLKKFDLCTTFTKGGIANKFLEEQKIRNIYIPNFARNVLETKNDKDYKKLLFNNNNITILYNACFEVRKNQHNVLLKIAESKKLQGYNWLFIGSQPSREYLQHCDELVKTRGLGKIVKFLKPTTNTEILDKLYQSVDLLMLTSIAEGLPLVLLEAISAGLPWIATPVGGIRGVLGETRTGIVLDKIDFSKEDIENALNDVQNIDKENIKSVWQENFNREKVCKMHLETFQELLNE